MMRTNVEAKIKMLKAPCKIPDFGWVIVMPYIAPASTGAVN